MYLLQGLKVAINWKQKKITPKHLPLVTIYGIAVDTLVLLFTFKLPWFIQQTNLI